MVLAWIVGAAAIWVVAGATVAFLVAAVIGRSHPASGAVSGADVSRIHLPAQRTASPAGFRSQPHLPCTGVGRSPQPPLTAIS